MSLTMPFVKDYNRLVKKNDKIVAQIEQISLILPYLAFGRAPGQELEYEGALSLLNLVNFYHDIVLDKSPDRLQKLYALPPAKLLRMLTLTQLFLEMYAVKRGHSEESRNRTILLIETTKFALRLWIYQHCKHNRKIIAAEELVPPKRDVMKMLVSQMQQQLQQQQQPALEDDNNNNNNNNNDDDEDENNNNSNSDAAKKKRAEEEEEAEKQTRIDFDAIHERRATGRALPQDVVGARSGRTMMPLVAAREVTAAVPTTDEQNFAEIVYICKPMIAAIAISACGRTSWKPWVISLLLDVAALQHSRLGGLSAVEKRELDRRYHSFAMYILRPPFYSTFLASPVEALLTGISSVPLGTTVAAAVRELIAPYQGYYFLTAK